MTEHEKISDRVVDIDGRKFLLTLYHRGSGGFSISATSYESEYPTLAVKVSGGSIEECFSDVVEKAQRKVDDIRRNEERIDNAKETFENLAV